ncbi:hypothetical protein LTA6_000608 [Microbacterium sp. LTA6]|uniref:hypothetical protein n=1 Tax=unclassified Microbacterium TaxID=2609290 RepID=UPI003138F5F8
MSARPASLASQVRRRRRRRRMERYYRSISPAMERMKTIGTTVLVVGGVGFLVWVFAFYR